MRRIPLGDRGTAMEPQSTHKINILAPNLQLFPEKNQDKRCRVVRASESEVESEAHAAAVGRVGRMAVGDAPHIVEAYAAQDVVKAH